MNMTCNAVRDLAELYLEGLLRPQTQRTVRSHLRGCKACRAYYKECRALHTGAASPAPGTMPESWLERQDMLYADLSKKLRRRRFWNIVCTSAAIGAGSVMLTAGLVIMHRAGRES